MSLTELWEQEQVNKFENIKEIKTNLCSVKMLKLMDFEEIFVLKIDYKNIQVFIRKAYFKSGYISINMGCDDIEIVHHAKTLRINYDDRINGLFIKDEENSTLLQILNILSSEQIDFIFKFVNELQMEAVCQQ